MIVTEDNFNEVVKSNDLILIDFWASWCKPCGKLSPILDEISEETGIPVGKINIDDNVNKTEEYHVTSIPTVIIFKNGTPTKRIIGAQPKHKIMDEIKEWI
jgi:thioredoxin 1